MKRALLILTLLILSSKIAYCQIDAVGNATAIGLGATSTDPAFKFTYQSNSVAHYGLGWYSDADVTGAPMAYLGGYGGIKFFTSGTPRFIITNTGNVGIGTTTPLSPLHILGSSASNKGELSITNTDVGGNTWRIGEAIDAAAGTFTIYNVNNNLLPFAIAGNTGNVGIGTTTPGALLSVSSAGAAGNSTAIRLDNVFNNPNNRNWTLGLNTTAYGDFSINQSNAQNGDPNFAGTIRFYINPSGNIGIGTTSPSSLLELQQVAPMLTLTPSTYSGLYKTTLGTASGAQGFLIFGNNGQNEIRAGNSNPGGYLDFFTNNSVGQDNASNGNFVMRMAVNGYVGIGTTTPGALLSVSSAGAAGNSTAIRLDNSFNTPNNRNWTLGLNTIAYGDFSINQSSAQDGDPNISRFYINLSGNVGLGTTAVPAGYKLAVAGSAIAESMTVKLQSAWGDYVFKKDYALMPLSDVKSYIDKNQHLPDIPAAAEVEKDGVNLGEMNRLLVKKVEELTLYLIEKDNKDKEKEARLRLEEDAIKQLQTTNQSLEERLNKLAAQLNELNKQHN